MNCKNKNCKTKMSEGSPEYCPEHQSCCAHLPEGEVLPGHDHRVNKYDSFIRRALAAGFSDEQVDFLEEEILKTP